MPTNETIEPDIDLMLEAAAIAQAEDAQAEPNIEVIDGYRIDIDTGEVLGYAEEPPEFTVHDEDSANWVLGKMLDAESQLAAIETSAEVIRARAVLENAAKLRKEQERKLSWWHKRFDNELGEFARKRLEGQKTKTLKTLLGSISLRVKKGGLKVLFPDIALRCAKAYQWDEAVKTTESFLISNLSDEHRQLIATGIASYTNGDPGWYDELILQGFTVEPDSETVTVKTGITV